MPAGKMTKYVSRKSVMRKRLRRRVRKSGALTTVARTQTYPFRRFHYRLTVSGSDNSIGGNGLTFALSELPNASEFTGLFDQFKIAGIKYRWSLNRSPDYGGAVVSNVYNTAVQGVFPRIMWVHDYDDGAAIPSNFAELQQYPKMQQVYLTPDRPFTRWFYIKPARQTVEYETAVNSGYRPTWKGFVDCNSSTLPHSGIRMFYDGLNTGIQLRLECWYYLVFKNVR